ncbi:hypothetical protein CNMCM5793_005211 [Aspergillus hiratsukae]|uniref:Uncharacterized protein n=1 Tax=Aspergillus hiratsukae TaxID=1194566 RepID=A0A8H6QJI9_9EURO|nr:hypothetical protein CNMCM5793_005211 [Aspergillus hiratsukae]KAF7173032.1 hypothetical protein CNMCM6106_007175 [Aspergillus hiratsukae]
MTTTSQNSPWVLKKAVLVHAPNLDVFCRADLRIDHNQTARQGSISLSITANLANMSGRSQVLTLNIPPDRVGKCALARKSNDNLCPSHFLSILPAPVTNVSDVSTLSLSLGTTGIVLCPSGMESLSPATPGHVGFRSFARICQSEFIRLHFSRRQFVNKELDKLENFSCALRKRSLQTVSFNHARHGVVQKDWRVFSLSPDPPPYCQEPLSKQAKEADPPLYCEESVSEQGVGKRRRDPWSMSPNDERRKRLLLPSPQLIGSPTEVNTPSTLSPSPASIRPTYFTHASSPGHTECKRLTRLENELRGVSDDLIRQLLIRSGRQHLLAMPKDVDRDIEKISFAEVETIERRLKRYVDEIIERRLKSHVLDEIVDSAVSECRDQIYDECKTNEAEFREQVDDGNSEVRNTANECMNEIKEQARRCMHEMEEQAQQYMKDIEDQGIEVEMSAEEKVAKFKRWFNASAQSLLGSKSSPSHEPGANARRSSI